MREGFESPMEEFQEGNVVEKNDAVDESGLELVINEDGFESLDQVLHRLKEGEDGEIEEAA
jgi:hypothetical protein